MGVSGDRWPLARSGCWDFFPASRGLLAFKRNRAGDAAGGKYGRRVRERKRRRRANAAFNHNCEKIDDGRRGSGPPCFWFVRQSLLQRLSSESGTHWILGCLLSKFDSSLSYHLSPSSRSWSGASDDRETRLLEGFPSLPALPPQSPLGLGFLVTSFVNFVFTT